MNTDEYNDMCEVDEDIYTDLLAAHKRTTKLIRDNASFETEEQMKEIYGVVKYFEYKAHVFGDHNE